MKSGSFLARLGAKGSLLCALAALPLLASAGPCDALFHFDGSLNDSGGNGYGGAMIGPEGVPATPQFVPGKSGQAIRLDGSSVMRSFIDLHPDVCPQVTLTGWMKVEDGGSTETQFVISTGNYGSPGLSTAGTILSQAATGNGLWVADAVRPGSDWMFVAASYDNVAREYRLHWRTRSESMAMGANAPPPKEALWIGAFDDKLSHPSQGILLDEFQIIGRILSNDEVLAMQTSSANAIANNTTSASSAIDTTPRFDTATGTATTGSGSAAATTACNASSACPSGSYCAIDGTCHPDSHAPMPASSGAGGLDALNAQLAEQNSQRIPDIDYQPPTDPLAGAQTASSGMTVDEWNAQQAARNAGRFGDIERDPMDVLGAASSGTGGGSASSGTGSDTSGPAGGTVSEYLPSIDYDRAPSGDVRECTSFAEVVRDTATTFRNEIVKRMVANVCPFLDVRISETRAAKSLEALGEVITSDHLRSAEFGRDVLNEAYENCIATNTDGELLPIDMIAFWNANVANNNWATIGPRSLVYRKTHNGNLVSPGDRKFITPYPAQGQDETFLVLKELEGKARVNAKVCTVSMFNEYRRIYEFTVNATDQSQKDEGQYYGYDLTDIRGKYIIVYLNAAGRLGRNFKYTLSID